MVGSIGPKVRSNLDFVANILLQRMAFDGFIFYHQRRKEKKSLLETSLSHYRKNISREYISKWHNQASINRLRSSLMQIAVLMADKYILSQFFRAWNNRWFNCDQVYKHNALAFETNQLFRIRKAFRYWCDIAKKYRTLELFYSMLLFF